MLAEVVYVLMDDGSGREWFCTGTLVSKTAVVTAAHCLEERFTRIEVVAPMAAASPRVAAEGRAVYGGSYEDVGEPDVGILRLESPIELPAYAELTDVVARVEGGDRVTAAALVRQDEEPEARLALSARLPVSSTTAYGYAEGFGTPLFTKGGDSGAGLFLVEDGVVTHRLIGVARQPEPKRDIDHFTRMSASFAAWFAKNAQR